MAPGVFPARVGPCREGSSELPKQPAELSTAAVVNSTTPVRPAVRPAARRPVRDVVRGVGRTTVRVVEEAAAACFRRVALTRMAVPPPAVG
ncbi:hypothetical protein SSPO_067980 [Streptomyces antimycoticus]|uniref:Uncharacterized protein n=1 Tax=Streptomyces antimycoticus TaxID=68175 RepID=A0A499UTW2_9ACTN|nr:hypothetical protein SSPO_067980 [Streptomyces antimycoticus]